MTQKQEGLSKKTTKMNMLHKRTNEILCISSICDDGLHILFWDFDDINIFDVFKSLSKTQSINGLNSIFILQSRNGFNAFCLDKFYVEHAHHILYYTRWNDFSHQDIGWKNNSWALRLGPDKKLIKILNPTNSYIGNIQSNAHRKFFKKLLKNIPQLNWGKFDNLSKVQLEKYKQDII